MMAVAGGDPGPAGLLGDALGAESAAACLEPAAAVGCCARGVMQREMRAVCAAGLVARCMITMSSSVESPAVESIWEGKDLEE